MATADRTPTDALTGLRQRARHYEFFQALRLVDAAHRDLPPLGEAAGPHDEAVRIGIDPGLDFAATDFAPAPAPRPPTVEREFLRLDSRGLGLLGPNGPLPLHMTEQVRAALLHERDAAPLHFLEMLQHRLISLFYRAYGQSRASIQADRPETDHFALYLGALFGRHSEAVNRDAFFDASRLYFTGRYAAATRSGEGLEAIVTHEFHVAATVTPFALGWLRLEPATQTVLGRPDEATSLGVATIAGARVRNRQSHIHLRLGPMPRSRFQRFLPAGEDFAPLAAMVEEFTRGELFCRVQLLLDRRDVPATVLGREGRLGFDSWLGGPPAIAIEVAGDAEFPLC
ncbi:MAG: type VI secretion system baseplate subunit TssG [Planctomycetaceae bacterium]